MLFARAHIERIGYELAPVVVSSSELEERLAPVYDKLRVPFGQLEAMTGIVERRFWQPGYDVVRGATQAARATLAASSVPSSEIEALIYGGVCRQHFEPATACHVAAGLEQAGLPIARGATIYDLSNACLGVVNGMVEIANRIELGQIRAGMVVSCESAREIVDTMIERMLAEPTLELFSTSVATLTGGSAAVAVILTDGSFGSAGSGARLRGGVVGNAPVHHMLCRWGVEAEPRPSRTGQASLRAFMSTDAVQVLEHGVVLGAQTWERLLRELDWGIDDVDRTVCHQVGSRHREVVLEALGVEPRRDFVAYDYLGNTGTAALPLALALASERSFVTAGQRVALLGIGSGLNCVMLGVDW